ncbi:HEPN domain-containing protein [Phreatobacter sp.]|uniref:HEPN domain-containing protein n=1 Tax=Phreatobacter sp. TaxID=1966341 RepID=UPI0025FC9223|nr:HEPN domain-containing protein [Phreatobacter sp.]
MTTVFEAITDDFLDDLGAIAALVGTFGASSHPIKARIAAANSSTLLLAATFEEFVREMAREFARAVVLSASSVDNLPKKMTATAWKRTMDGLGRIKFDKSENGLSDAFGSAQSRFSIVYDFCRGDLSKDIYRELIHNERNMRPDQLNELFNVSGLGNVCRLCYEKPIMRSFYGEDDNSNLGKKFFSSFNDFFERRNDIAHALSAQKSNGPQQIETDIRMMTCFAQALRETLEGAAPLPSAMQSAPEHENAPGG